MSSFRVCAKSTFILPSPHDSRSSWGINGWLFVNCEYFTVHLTTFSVFLQTFSDGCAFNNFLIPPSSPPFSLLFCSLLPFNSFSFFPVTSMKPREMFEQLNACIVGQEQAKKAVTIALSMSPLCLSALFHSSSCFCFFNSSLCIYLTSSITYFQQQLVFRFTLSYDFSLLHPTSQSISYLSISSNPCPVIFVLRIN